MDNSFLEKTSKDFKTDKEITIRSKWNDGKEITIRSKWNDGRVNRIQNSKSIYKFTIDKIVKQIQLYPYPGHSILLCISVACL